MLGLELGVLNAWSDDINFMMWLASFNFVFSCDV